MFYKRYDMDFSMPEQVPAQIKKIADDFMKSPQFLKIIDGYNYYNVRNTKIMERKMQYFEPQLNGDGKEAGGYLRDDPYKANNQICSGYFNLLVDQMDEYLISNDPTISEDAEKALDNDGLIDKSEFFDAMRETAEQAQIKYVGWTYFYIENNELKFKVIPTEEIISVYGRDGQSYVIRIYKLTTVNNDGELEEANIVEVYDAVMLTTYIKFEKDDGYNLFGEPKYHIVEKKSLGGSVFAQTGVGFGKPPFAALYYNSSGLNVLETVKSFIDIYDVVNSDFANNFEDFLDEIHILKNYGGENLSEFIGQLKRYKAIKVGDDGEYTNINREVPYLARKEYLQILNDAIFKFGKGVDTNQVGDGNITNIVIKARYAALDMKANRFAKQIKKYYKEALYFINFWLSRNGKPQITDDDIAFNKQILINETEMLEANAKQQGNISDKTRLKNNPWVQNVKDEQELIAKEAGAVKLVDPKV